MLHFSTLGALCCQVTFQKATEESDVLHVRWLVREKAPLSLWFADANIKQKDFTKTAPTWHRPAPLALDPADALAQPQRSARARSRNPSKRQELVCVPSDICTARCKTAVTMAWWMNTWTHMFLYRIANTAISCGRRLVRLQKFAHQACSTIVRSAYQVQRNTPVPPNLQKQQQLMAKHSLSPTRAPVKVCTSLPRTVKAESTTSAVSSFVKEKAQPRHLPAALFGHESSSNAEKTWIFPCSTLGSLLLQAQLTWPGPVPRVAGASSGPPTLRQQHRHACRLLKSPACNSPQLALSAIQPGMQHRAASPRIVTHGVASFTLQWTLCELFQFTWCEPRSIRQSSYEYVGQATTAAGIPRQNLTALPRRWRQISDSDISTAHRGTVPRLGKVPFRGHRTPWLCLHPTLYVGHAQKQQNRYPLCLHGNTCLGQHSADLHIIYSEVPERVSLTLCDLDVSSQHPGNATSSACGLLLLLLPRLTREIIKPRPLSTSPA